MIKFMNGFVVGSAVTVLSGVVIGAYLLTEVSHVYYKKGCRESGRGSRVNYYGYKSYREESE